MSQPHLSSVAAVGYRAGGAELSPCGRYRYKLWRQWAPGTTCCWIMLNPSTADATEDDPTIRRCIGFARGWGHGGIVVANLFAWRATRPRQLRDFIRSQLTEAATGDPRNREAIAECCAEAATIIAAWGAHADRWMPERGRFVQLDIEGEGRELMCLGRTRDGQPRHPLYVKGNVPLEAYR